MVREAPSRSDNGRQRAAISHGTISGAKDDMAPSRYRRHGATGPTAAHCRQSDPSGPMIGNCRFAQEIWRSSTNR